MAIYRTYKFKIRESEDSKPFLKILDTIIKVMKEKGLIKIEIEE